MNISIRFNNEKIIHRLKIIGGVTSLYYFGSYIFFLLLSHNFSKSFEAANITAKATLTTFLLCLIVWIVGNTCYKLIKKW